MRQNSEQRQLAARGHDYLQVLRMATPTSQRQAGIGLARQKFAGFGTFKFSRFFILRALG
jgi:hypothetical protein